MMLFKKNSNELRPRKEKRGFLERTLARITIYGFVLFDDFQYVRRLKFLPQLF